MIRWLILYPLSLLYGFIVFIRNKLFDYHVLRSHEFKLPVICVGNLAVGGTGKTPHIEYLVEMLKDDFRIAVLSRGYKRKTKKFVLATKDATSLQIGDEPKQMKQKYPELAVAVDKNRVHGINTLKNKIKDLKAVLLDDAFQHRYVSPGISVLLMDINKPIYEDRLLPMGRLRESHLEMRRAHIIIVTKTPMDIKPIDRRIIIKNLNAFPYQSVFFTSILYQQLKPVFTGNTRIVEKEEINKPKTHILLVTGIADASHLKEYLKQQLAENVTHIEYSDHHKFSRKDLRRIQETYNNIDGDDKLIITTEKDAARFASMQKKHLQSFPQIIKNMYYLPIKVHFIEDEDKTEFERQILEYVKENKVDSNLY